MPSPKPSVVKKRMLALDGLESAVVRCFRCSRDLPAAKFWDGKKRRLMRTCNECLYKQRTKKNPRRISYRRYLQSPEWAAKRKEFWDSAIMRSCYVCDDPWIDFKGKELHHLTYERLGNENLEDLVPVCSICHGKITKLQRLNRQLPSKERRSIVDLTNQVRSVSFVPRAPENSQVAFE